MSLKERPTNLLEKLLERERERNTEKWLDSRLQSMMLSFAILINTCFLKSIGCSLHFHINKRHLFFLVDVRHFWWCFLDPHLVVSVRRIVATLHFSTTLCRFWINFACFGQPIMWITEIEPFKIFYVVFKIRVIYLHLFDSFDLESTTKEDVPLDFQSWLITMLVPMM